ncbi:MAG: hypothetical protein AB7P69_03780 [Candidatus Binatia bacterium]
MTDYLALFNAAGMLLALIGGLGYLALDAHRRRDERTLQIDWRLLRLTPRQKLRWLHARAMHQEGTR